MRDHKGQPVDKFGGLYNRGDFENTPKDHFQGSNNIRHQGVSVFTRDGISISQNVSIVTPLTNVRRIYNYPMNDKNTLIALTYNVATNIGNIYHIISSTSQFGPILTKTGMTDFAFVPFGGRAYISPFTGFTTNNQTIEKGLSGEFLYVYAGDGSNARKAAGVAVGAGMTVAAGAAGFTDAGLHIYGVVSETVSGYLAPPGSLTTFTNIPAQSVSFGSIPTSGDPNVVKRHIVASKKITNFNGDKTGYDLFFIPNATINDNVTTFLNNISYFDQDLLEDASHLFDNYTEIPAGAFLTIYRGRLVLGSTFADMNLVLVSTEGEPEAINQITGILATQPNGFPVSNAAEFRDVLYVFRPNSTMSFTDNDDDPSTWLPIEVDAALGARPHAISQFLNSATQNVDFLIIGTYQGISLFTGTYQPPELSWKIQSFWQSLTQNDFGKIQIANNIIKKRIYVVLPDRNLLVGFFQNGLSSKEIQWEEWTFTQPINTIAVTQINEDIIGSDVY
jgi:hypothetical protein